MKRAPAVCPLVNHADVRFRAWLREPGRWLPRRHVVSFCTYCDGWWFDWGTEAVYRAIPREEIQRRPPLLSR